MHVRHSAGSMRLAGAIAILLLAVFCGAGALTEGVSGNPASFQRTMILPEWKEVDGFNAAFDHLLIEDGQGIVHLFYNDYSMNAYHRVLGADGVWSPPEPAAPVPLNSDGYRAAIAPDGTLCFVWMEDARFQNGEIQDLTNVLHVKRYRNGLGRRIRRSAITGTSTAGRGYSTASRSPLTIKESCTRCIILPGAMATLKRGEHIWMAGC